MAASPIVLKVDPGIKRDGTKFDGNFYTDGQWVRFQRGLPRKIGGYRSITKYLPEISRGITSYAQNGYVYCHSGSASELQRFTIDQNFNSSIMTDRTPVGLTSSDNNLWSFDYMYDSSALGTSIIAHVAPNSVPVSNDSGGAIYSGDVAGTSALTAITVPAGADASGGIVVLHPYLFYFGTGGIIGWSVAGEPTDLSSAGSGIARPWGTKIVKGLPLRGVGSGPAGIFWAYDAVIRAVFTGGSTVFEFDVLATDTSIMSAASVIDYDGVFYWAGVDRFMMFNGVARELQNTMNLNWFFDGINQEYKSKVFAFKNARYGEIWWCYPRGTATECTHAIIYNVRENSWYDTELPNSGRSSGLACTAYAVPIMAGVEESTSGFKVWVHEEGTDAISGSQRIPVQSYFETADISAVATQGINTRLHISAIEPDFVQDGDMKVQIVGRANAKAPEVYSSEFTFPATATYPYQEIVMLKEQRRELRVKFISDTLGGDYQMGQIILHIDQGDKQVLG